MPETSVPSTVDHLIDAAVSAMERVPGEFSDLEVLSACFTMALRTATVMQQRHPELHDQILRAAQLVLLNCANEHIIH